MVEVATIAASRFFLATCTLAVLLLSIDVHDPSRLANDPAPGTGNSEERCPQVGSDDEEHRVVLEGS
jgi:hypothetical protein